MSAKCSSCGAEIVWAKTVNGKAIPLNARPEKRFVLMCGLEHIDDPARMKNSPFLREGESLPEGTTAYLHGTFVSHFATCPNAAQHRRPK